MKKNVAMMELDVSKRRSYSRKVCKVNLNLYYYYYFLFYVQIERLRNDIELLRFECNKLTVQVDTAIENRGKLN